MSTVRIHWVRHGEIASHSGNIPLTDEGLAHARERGRLLAEELSPGETVHFMHAPTLRTQQTIEELRSSMDETLGSGSGVELLQVSEQWAIRNPDVYVAGQRVEMVSGAEILAQQLSAPPVDPRWLSEHPFFSGFWASKDPIGYWIEYPDPPGEDPVAVARRQITFAMSLMDSREDESVRYVLSTHSPVMRAILLCYLGKDSGEPDYLELIDLVSSKDGLWELRYRDLREPLSDAKTNKDASR